MKRLRNHRTIEASFLGLQKVDLRAQRLLFESGVLPNTKVVLKCFRPASVLSDGLTL
jgi:hypothetical protein